MHGKCLVLCLVLLVALSPAHAADPLPDENASFSGPWGGAQGQVQMAQSFEMSVTGTLNGIEAYVPANSGPGCEFTWTLRDGATLDPDNPDIAALPVLASGTGVNDAPGSIYEAQPSVLLTGASLPVTAGDLLVLHIVRECSFVWILGVGLLPGNRFEFDGATWSRAGVANLELGRVIYATETGTPVESTSWGSAKSTWR